MPLVKSLSKANIYDVFARFSKITPEPKGELQYTSAYTLLVAVVTHVFRVSNRIGLTTNAKNPLQSELQLLKLFPEEKLNIAHHWLILHGRYVCKARRAECENCGITSICKHYKKNKK